MMKQKDPAEFFDEAHAATYDERFAKLAPLRQALDFEEMMSRSRRRRWWLE